MATVYGVGLSPFVRKVRVFMAEKGLPYEKEDVIPVNVSADYKKISPLGKIPAYRDGDKTLADSSVICAYLERVHPKPPLYPTDAYPYARALWFEEYADSGLAPIVGAKIFFQKIVGPKFFNQPTDEAIVKTGVEQDLPPLLDYLESQLGAENAFVGGSFSIADIAIGAQLVNLRHAGFGVDTKRWPKLARHTAATHERPSFRALVDEERALLGIK